MAKQVFIDGEAGTTGLQVRGRLESRADIELLTLPESDRKSVEARKAAINAADAVILCLPDAAAIEAASLVDPENTRTVLIDASTAHRTNPEWAYGFPELCAGQRAVISASKRISNPGCYATGFIAATRPLVDAGLLKQGARLVASAISGYSGGGKPLIGIFEGSEPHEPWGAYAFGLEHKHLPEMACYGKLQRAPIFLPAVGDFAQGMVVSVPLHYDQDLVAVSNDAAAAGGGVGKMVHAALSKHYEGQKFVTVKPFGEEGFEDQLERGSFLRPDALNDSNNLEVFVYANDAQGTCVVSVRLDNLGKGASGAAVQNLNLALGLDENAGL